MKEPQKTRSTGRVNPGLPGTWISGQKDENEIDPATPGDLLFLNRGYWIIAFPGDMGKWLP